MSQDQPEWERLNKALSVEAERGYNNIQGREYRFNEFISITFKEIAKGCLNEYTFQWQSMGLSFDMYDEYNLLEKQQLVEATREFLQEMEEIWADKIAETYVKYIPNSAKLESNKPELERKNTVKEIKPPLAQVKNVVNTKLDGVISLDQPLSKVDGIGLSMGEKLGKLNLKIVRDLLYYYPRSHADYANQVPICELVAGETVTLIGKIKNCTCFTSPKNKKLTILNLTIKDQTGQIKITRYFAGPRYTNKGWQMQQQNMYPPGALIVASGLVKHNKYQLTLDNPELEVLDTEGGTIESIKIGRLVPVYPLTEGVGADVVRKSVLKVMPAVELLKDGIPKELQEQHQLIELKKAISHIHFPLDRDWLSAARRRLVYDEFFYLQLGLLKRREMQKKQPSAPLVPTGKLIQEFYQLLPFELTKAQKRVINEILNDLQKTSPMNRLVQGDVGAGKTVIAVVGMLAAIQAGYQTALMAPTEVLAEQHYRKLVSWFNLIHIPVELLTGSTKVKKRRQIYSEIETGELPILVGTHALIQDTVNFNRLGLVVIDEQHRFGVEQRAKLQQKGASPHVLTMTATPIPRTLALTLHGDLDVSQVDELPPGRQPIQTTAITAKQRTEAYDLITREVAQGRQAYVILPLVEESDKLVAKSAVEEYKKLSETVFPDFQIGLLHGKMSSAEKDESINNFRDNKTQILVSTTVVEVGVDVPNATVMLIENAERFGLSQLHQLRGRVGRGKDRSYCLLLCGNYSQEARYRLGVLEQSQDGFFISEMDLKLRGPGQVLGMRQSGLPDFALASLVEDQEVLELARQGAQKLIGYDANLDSFPLTKLELDRRYQQMLGGSILT